MDTLTFDSADLGEIEASVSDLYSRMRIGATGKRTRARITRRAPSPMLGFDDLDYSFDIGYAAEPPNMLLICEVERNILERSTEGREESFGPGELFLLSPPGHTYSGVAHATRHRMTIVDPALLARVASAAGQQADSPIRLLDVSPVSESAAKHLQRSIAHIRDNVMTLPDLGEAALVVSTASQYLAASVLQAFPTTALVEPTAQDHHDAHSATVRRAVAYIEGSAGDDIDLVAIAAAAYVSPRALQYAFRRHLDTTPMAYLRRVRLDAAHRELEAADPSDGIPVTTVATRWGFPYPSRFATTYRRAYGQHPRTTLHGTVA